MSTRKNILALFFIGILSATTIQAKYTAREALNSFISGYTCAVLPYFWPEIPNLTSLNGHFIRSKKYDMANYFFGMSGLASGFALFGFAAYGAYTWATKKKAQKLEVPLVSESVSESAQVVSEK